MQQPVGCPECLLPASLQALQPCSSTCQQHSTSSNSLQMLKLFRSLPRLSSVWLYPPAATLQWCPLDFYVKPHAEGHKPWGMCHTACLRFSLIYSNYWLGTSTLVALGSSHPRYSWPMLFSVNCPSDCQSKTSESFFIPHHHEYFSGKIMHVIKILNVLALSLPDNLFKIWVSYLRFSPTSLF